MVRVQKIRVPDTGRLSWIVIDREHVPVEVVNEYLVYLHRLGRSPNTVRAYAHHLQAYWAFLVLVEEALGYALVGVYAAVAEEGPVLAGDFDEFWV